MDKKKKPGGVRELIVAVYYRAAFCESVRVGMLGNTHPAAAKIESDSPSLASGKDKCELSSRQQFHERIESRIGKLPVQKTNRPLFRLSIFSEIASESNAMVFQLFHPVTGA